MTGKRPNRSRSRKSTRGKLILDNHNEDSVFGSDPELSDDEVQIVVLKNKPTDNKSEVQPSDELASDKLNEDRIANIRPNDQSSDYSDVHSDVHSDVQSINPPNSLTDTLDDDVFLSIKTNKKDVNVPLSLPTMALSDDPTMLVVQNQSSDVMPTKVTPSVPWVASYSLKPQCNVLSESAGASSRPPPPPLMLGGTPYSDPQNFTSKPSHFYHHGFANNSPNVPNDIDSCHDVDQRMSEFAPAFKGNLWNSNEK